MWSFSYQTPEGFDFPNWSLNQSHMKPTRILNWCFLLCHSEDWDFLCKLKLLHFLHIMAKQKSLKDYQYPISQPDRWLPFIGCIKGEVEHASVWVVLIWIPALNRKLDSIASMSLWIFHQHQMKSQCQE